MKEWEEFTKIGLEDVFYKKMIINDVIICVTTLLIDWKPLRALYTLLHRNDVSIVKEIKIGQSAAKTLNNAVKYDMRKVQRLSKSMIHELSRVVNNY
jgi:uncharacterized membrane protein (UPF0182 family)